MELTGGLRRLAVLKMGYSFFQRLGTLGRHLVTEESDLRLSEYALCRVDEATTYLKLVEERQYVLLLLLKRPGEKEDIIQVDSCICNLPGG